MVTPSQPRRPEQPPDQQALVIRAATLGLIAAGLFAILIFRLWALQVLHSDHYVAQANSNDVRQLALPAPRGQIEDRTGTVLVSNTSKVLAEINPAGLPTKVTCSTFPAADQATCAQVVAATPPGAVPRCGVLPQQLRCIELSRLGKVLEMKRHEIWQLYERNLLVNGDGSGGCVLTKDHPCYVVNAGSPIQLTSATEAQVAYVLERRGQFHGVQFVQTTQRQYPFRDLAANVLGYVSQISQGELTDPNFHGVKAGSDVGQTGVEYSYDSKLRGIDGVLQQAYDASGRAVGQPYVQQAAQPGDTLQLTIDYRLQRIAQKAIQYGIQVAHANQEPYAHTGAIVAMDPRNGQILAMASYPSYNPSAFLPPAKGAARLYRDTYNQPLVDKTLTPGPPGSTFKSITAISAWNTGLLGPGTTLGCPGSFTVPGDTSGTVFHNWTLSDLGTMNLPEAIEQSCDTFFYQLGYDFYLRHNYGIEFQQQIRHLGFGARPPLDIPVPSYDSGLVPDPAWRIQTYSNPLDQAWNPGYDIQMAIGQGDLTVSPMQLAVAYSAIANGGTLVTPHLGKDWVDSTGKVHSIDPKPQANLHLSPTLLSELRQGLYMASHSSLGTSSAVFGNFTPSVVGKTGTADHLTKTGANAPPNAWYASFAPCDPSSCNPKLVVVALINDGGHGGVAAAPAALQVFRAYFDHKYGNLAHVVGTDASH
ncbi:MAG TPA: penicillin-binding transpeptidase domain-containing protein [Gaiellales bacterium]|nr:penicillin-binding transpeptidase domain-containing protein [Gaiellales bacterium]